jgi:hypothetical protein
MSGFFSFLNSVSSRSTTTTTTTTTTNNNSTNSTNEVERERKVERKRVAALREEHTSQPLLKWDTSHVCAWLSSIGLPQYVAIATSNMMTGAMLVRTFRNNSWNDRHYGLGEFCF